MDVPTQHCIDAVAFRVMSHSGFEFTDEAHGVLHPSLGIRAEGPVTQTETAPDKVDERIERQEKLIAKVARERQPLHPAAAGHYHVEFVTVNN